MSETKRGRKPKSVAELLQDAPTPAIPEIEQQRKHIDAALKDGEFIAIDTENGREFITNDLMFRNLSLGKKNKYVRKSEKPTELDNE